MPVRHDHAGRPFGRLTALYLHPKSTTKKKWWVCRCECGEEVVALAQDLVAGRRESCGACGRAAYDYTGREAESGHLVRDLTGGTFGALVVLARLPRASPRGVTEYRCRCECCGTEKVVRHGALASGNTRSCGAGQCRAFARKLPRQ